ncbi:MAG TPA: hypothetical protein VN577_11510 [Terriglobales bacterium]|nr:hypothetical protein [Terriglobales bacterium]
MSWFSARDSVTLLLIAWSTAIAVFAASDVTGRFIWIPVSLGLAGVMGSIIMLAIPANVMLASNIATIILFVVSLEVLKKIHRSCLASVRHRG